MKKQIVPSVILTSNFITVVTDKMHSITKSDPRFAEVIALYRERDYTRMVELLDRPAAIAKYTAGIVQVFDDQVLVNGKPTNNAVTKRIFDFIAEGLPFEPLVLFLNNLYKNTDEDVRNRLFLFLEHNNLPITERGSFLVYKLVKADGTPPYYNSTFTRLHPNGRAEVVKHYEVGGTYVMPKENVIKGGECSSGALLYAGNRNYWSSNTFNEQNEYTGDGRMLIGEVFPQDVGNVSAVESNKVAVTKLHILSEYKHSESVVGKTLYNTETKTVQKKVAQAPKTKSTYGTKPNGDRFYNARGPGGQFVRKS